jgi:glycerol uptake facilitator-like aquaporin
MRTRLASGLLAYIVIACQPATGTIGNPVTDPARSDGPRLCFWSCKLYLVILWVAYLRLPVQSLLCVLLAEVPG